MDAAITLRAQMKDSGAEFVPSFNDFVVKAAALSLRAHPRASRRVRVHDRELLEQPLRLAL